MERLPSEWLAGPLLLLLSTHRSLIDRFPSDVPGTVARKLWSINRLPRFLDRTFGRVIPVVRGGYKSLEYAFVDSRTRSQRSLMQEAMTEGK